MNNIVFVQNFEGSDNLGKVSEALCLLEAFTLLEELLKGSPVAVLIDEVKVIDSFEHVVILDDMFAGLQVTQNIDFVDGSFL